MARGHRGMARGHRGMARGAPWDGRATPWNGSATPWDGSGWLMGWLSHTVGWLRKTARARYPHSAVEPSACGPHHHAHVRPRDRAVTRGAGRVSAAKWWGPQAGVKRARAFVHTARAAPHLFQHLSDMLKDACNSTRQQSGRVKRTGCTTHGLAAHSEGGHLLQCRRRQQRRPCAPDRACRSCSCRWNSQPSMPPSCPLWRWSLVFTQETRGQTCRESTRPCLRNTVAVTETPRADRCAQGRRAACVTQCRRPVTPHRTAPAQSWRRDTVTG